MQREQVEGDTTAAQLVPNFASNYACYRASRLPLSS
jgi:hypothetical protein